MIRDAGLGAVARGIRPGARRAAACAAWRRSLDVESAVRPSRGRTGTPGPSPSAGSCREPRGGARIDGPGLTPASCRSSRPATRRSRAGARPTCARSGSSATSTALAAVPLGDLTSEQMRVARRARARVRRRHRARHDRAGSRSSAGSRRPTCGSSIAGWRPPGSASPRPARSPTSTSCPGAESCRLAVTQSRGLGRLLEEHLRARPDLVAAADGARIKISGCPNGCGQHHIATIGFQGSVRRVGGRAVPQYFVMVGGGVDERRRAVRRLAAKVPARRIPRGGRAADRALRARARAGRNGAGVLRPRRA